MLNDFDELSKYTLSKISFRLQHFVEFNLMHISLHSIGFNKIYPK